ncbi:hypothetical protein [Candidatus Protochlamydia amoebophila]|nr:hypothetical protein [Candidatus Protochlamydia amoebophila]
MINRWLMGLNSIILGSCCLLAIGIGVMKFTYSNQIICRDPKAKLCGLPKGAFELSTESYEQLNGPLLALNEASPSLQLPDLRQQLIYYGKNSRPDAQSEQTLLHFAFNTNKNIVSISPGERLYLVYDKESVPNKYIFSPQNKKTTLWIEAMLADSEVVVKLTLENDKGDLITEPENHYQFRLPEKEFIRFAGKVWELGTWRVDGTLLARQKARWFGIDRFLEKHGGEEYQHCLGKQRVDFGENENIYSVFIGPGDCLIWDENQWKVIQPGAGSRAYPLLVVKKIDERLLTLELWDVEGKGKILLNLLKSVEPWMVQNAQNIQHMFKFVGAKTRSQCVFEINNERMIVSPSDWLLMTQKGWKKLTSAEEIDDYVKRKTAGTLFVFERLVRKDDRQLMLGTLYNSTRSDSQSIELTLQQGNSNKSFTTKEMKDKEVKEPGETILQTEKGITPKGITPVGKTEADLANRIPVVPNLSNKN